MFLQMLKQQAVADPQRFHYNLMPSAAAVAPMSSSVAPVAPLNPSVARLSVPLSSPLAPPSSPMAPVNTPVAPSSSPVVPVSSPMAPLPTSTAGLATIPTNKGSLHSVNIKAKAVPVTTAAVTKAGENKIALVVPKALNPAASAYSPSTVTSSTVAAPASTAANAALAEAAPAHRLNVCFVCGQNTHFKSDCTTFKTKMCEFAQRNRCRHKDSAECFGAHSKSELRNAEEIHQITCENCGDWHVTSLCRKKSWATEKKMKPRDDDQDFEARWACEWCETDNHSHRECPDRWCKTCETGSHWTKYCQKCANCKDFHRTRDCPYVVVRRG